jgi:hypothetical protein
MVLGIQNLMILYILSNFLLKNQIYRFLLAPPPKKKLDLLYITPRLNNGMVTGQKNPVPIPIKVQPTILTNDVSDVLLRELSSNSPMTPTPNPSHVVNATNGTAIFPHMPMMSFNKSSSDPDPLLVIRLSLIVM